MECSILMLESQIFIKIKDTIGLASTLNFLGQKT